MTYKSDILLGRITKINGYKGAVTVKLDKLFSENITQVESVFLEIEGKMVPFFISFSEYTGTGILKLGFEGYSSVERISEFIGCRVFLTDSITVDNQSDDLQRLAGYQVFIQNDKLLGSIKEVIPNPGQWLLNIKSTSNRDILIPFHEHFIVAIDNENRILMMNIPEGLIEINS
jgi:16S rRNA processing protein RimM